MPSGSRGRGSIRGLMSRIWGPTPTSTHTMATGSPLTSMTPAWRTPSSMGKFLGPVAIASAGIGLGATGIRAISNMGNSFMRGIAPSSAYPTMSGRFGIRTAEGAAPAGIAGLKFNFRRRR